MVEMAQGIRSEPMATTDASTEEVVTSVGIESVAVEAADGLAIQGTLYALEDDQPHPGVILLHMLGSSREAWVDSGLTTMLAENGYTVLAVDMRGHGTAMLDRQPALAEFILAWLNQHLK